MIFLSFVSILPTHSSTDQTEINPNNLQSRFMESENPSIPNTQISQSYNSRVDNCHNNTHNHGKYFISPPGKVDMDPMNERNNNSKNDISCSEPHLINTSTTEYSPLIPPCCCMMLSREREVTNIDSNVIYGGGCCFCGVRKIPIDQLSEPDALGVRKLYSINNDCCCCNQDHQVLALVRQDNTVIGAIPEISCRPCKICLNLCSSGICISTLVLYSPVALVTSLLTFCPAAYVMFGPENPNCAVKCFSDIFRFTICTIPIKCIKSCNGFALERCYMEMLEHENYTHKNKHFYE